MRPRPASAPDEPRSQSRSGAKPSAHRLDRAAVAVEPAQAGAADLEDAGLHRQVAAEVAEPADARCRAAVDVASRPPANDASLRERERHARVVARLHVEQRGEVAHGARHRPFGAELRDPDVRAGQRGTRPWLGRKPKTLFQAAGLRRLPMKSLPSATGSMRGRERDRGAAAAAAGRLASGRRRCGSTPNTSLKVCEPRPNSGVLVLPMTMQPAAFIRCDHQRVVGRHEVAQQRRAERRRDALRLGRRP